MTTIFDYICKLAPCLIFLRVSGIGHVSIGSELCAALGMDVGNYLAQTSASAVTLPSSLKKVYVKPSSYWSEGECGTPGIIYMEEAEYLQEMNRIQDDRFVLLKAYKRVEERESGTTTAEWEAAINGEEGCWSARDKLPCDEDLEYEESEPGSDQSDEFPCLFD